MILSTHAVHSAGVLLVFLVVTYATEKSSLPDDNSFEEAYTNTDADRGTSQNLNANAFQGNRPQQQQNPGRSAHPFIPSGSQYNPNHPGMQGGQALYHSGIQGGPVVYQPGNPFLQPGIQFVQPGTPFIPLGMQPNIYMGDLAGIQGTRAFNERMQQIPPVYHGVQAPMPNTPMIPDRQRHVPLTQHSQPSTFQGRHVRQQEDGLDENSLPDDAAFEKAYTKP